MNKRRTPRRKRKMTTMTFEVDQDLYQAVKEKLRPLAVTPEYAFQQMIRDAASDAKVLLRQAEFRAQAKDHPTLPSAPETHYLKCGIYQVFPV